MNAQRGPFAIVKSKLITYFNSSKLIRVNKSFNRKMLCVGWRYCPSVTTSTLAKARSQGLNNPFPSSLPTRAWCWFCACPCFNVRSTSNTSGGIICMRTCLGTNHCFYIMTNNLRHVSIMRCIFSACPKIRKFAFQVFSGLKPNGFNVVLYWGQWSRHPAPSLSTLVITAFYFIRWMASGHTLRSSSCNQPGLASLLLLRKTATSGTHAAEHHAGSGAFAPTFSHVWAIAAFADSMQSVSINKSTNMFYNLTPVVQLYPQPIGLSCFLYYW